VRTDVLRQRNREHLRDLLYGFEALRVVHDRLRSIEEHLIQVGDQRIPEVCHILTRLDLQVHVHDRTHQTLHECLVVVVEQHEQCVDVVYYAYAVEYVLPVLVVLLLYPLGLHLDYL
jgi:hypothetical protein